VYISDLPVSLTQLSQGKISLRAKHNCRLDTMLQVRMGVGVGRETVFSVSVKRLMLCI